MDYRAMARIEMAKKVTQAVTLREAKRQGYSIALNDDGIECELPTGKCIDTDPGNLSGHRFYFVVERWAHDDDYSFWDEVWGELILSNGSIVDCDAPICAH